MALYAINNKLNICELSINEKYIHQILKVYQNDSHLEYLWLIAEPMDIVDIVTIINRPLWVLIVEEMIHNNKKEYKQRYFNWNPYVSNWQNKISLKGY